MAENELKRYPRGQMKMAGDLVQVSDARFRHTNNARLLHTLRASPSGYVKGNSETSFDFTALIDEDGTERDWEEIARNAEGKTFQFIKPAADAAVVFGTLVQVEVSMAAGEPVTLTASGIGKFIE